MPAISLLSKTYTYTNGNPNDADEVELDLANAYANFGTIQTDYNQLVTGAYTLAGVKTFSSPITLAANNASVAGSLGYSSNVLSYYNGTKRVTLPQVLNANNYLGGKPPTYTSAATITLPASLTAMDSTNANIMVVASDQVVSLASSGANGLDTGSEASDTWYYVYLIGDSTGVNSPKGLFSVTNESVSGTITLPSGYDIKRQLPLAIRNDSSSDIIPFYCKRHGHIYYDVHMSPTGSGPTNVLYVTTSATTYTNVDCSTYVPPISRIALLDCRFFFTGAAEHNVREDGSSIDGYGFQTQSSGNFTNSVIEQKVSSSQVIEYKSGNSVTDSTINVFGYIVTEVSYV